jgi:predicted metal-dependent hydrolase
MIQLQQTLVISPYLELYHLLIPKDNILRQIKDLVDFSFVYEELKTNYCLDNGRNAIDPIRMFKYLLLKTIFEFSDVDLVERSKYDMSFKYFLDMAPEESVIDSSSLTKFRKLRLKDLNVLDMLINKTVDIAIEKDIIQSKAIIVDATHTKARYNQKSPREMLQDRSRKLRKAVYKADESLKAKLPVKNTSDVLEEEITYCQKLIDVIEAEGGVCPLPKIKEPLNLLKETVADDLEQLQISQDRDAKVGHKSADSSFFGYKTHIAMTEERMITAAIVTTGEKNDGKQLQELIEKSKAAGMEVRTVIGDTAYSEKDNIAYTKGNDIELIAKLNPLITQGGRKKEDEFQFNKDAGMYICKAGHMATRKARQGKKGVGKNQVDTYYFDIEICKRCPLKEGCYTEGAKHKTYSVSIKSGEHTEQMAFQESEYFKEKAPWILKNVRYFKDVQPEYTANKEYVSGESFKYLGKQYRLKVEETEEQEGVKYYQGYIYLFVKDKRNYSLKEKLINDWFREKAVLNFKKSLERVFPIIEKYGIKKPEIQIRTMKARWGSCLKEKYCILLNFDLIKAPKYCIDYVILHELTHFKYRNHDVEFYNFMTSLMPDWKQRKEILDEEVVRQL